MRFGRRLFMMALGASMLAHGPASAQTLSGEDGRLIASNCFQCHGTNGFSTSGGFERLGGKKAAEIFKELKEMQRGSRSSGKEESGEELMKVHASAYSDAELWALAQFFAAQKKPKK